MIDRRTWWLVLAAASTACTSAAIEERSVAAAGVTPYLAQRVMLPAGTRAVAAWVDAEGGGVVALDDGRLLSIDAVGRVGSIDRVPGEAAMPMEAGVSQFASRGPAESIALTPGGALLVQRGLVRRASLPAFLGAPAAFTRFGPEALWATPGGIFASEGDRWYALEMTQGAVTGTTQLAAFGGAGRREAWVLHDGTVSRVRFGSGAEPTVTWVDVAPGVDLGRVTSIATMDDARNVAVGERGVTVVGAQSVRRYASADRGAPAALAGGGGWAWVAWGSALLRTDGERWQQLLQGPGFGDGTRLAVDSTTGTTALVVNASGELVRVEAEQTLRISGLADGTFVFDTGIDLEAVTSPARQPAEVRYALDGSDAPLVARTTAPWGWADDGARRRDLGSLAFGSHTVEISARYEGGPTLQRTVRFDYASPLGRVPGYAADVAPLFRARCARCHANGVARDLSTFEALADQAPVVRSAVREGRMPPDVLLDPQSAALITAWVDGETPP